MTNTADQYLQRYHAGSTDQRRSAIIKLGKSGDPRGLPILEQIADNDVDATLRDLAVKALRHIEAQQQAAQIASNAISNSNSVSSAGNASNYEPPVPVSVPGSASIADAASIVPPTILPLAISEQKRKLSRSQMDHALSLQMSGQIDKARAMFAEALRTNPELQSDSFAANLAMSLTGEPIEQALATINAENAKANGGGGRGAATFTSAIALGEVIETLLELVILFIVVTLFVGAFYSSIGRLLTSSLLLGTSSQRVTDQLAGFMVEFDSAHVVPESLKYGLEWMLSTLLSIVAIYVVGTLTGGSGGFLRFVRWVSRAYMGIYTAEFVGILLVLFSLILFTQNPANKQTAQAMLGIGGVLVGFSVLAGFVLIAWTVGRAHEFGLFKGFRAIFLGGLALKVILFIVGFLTAFSSPGLGR